jgi:hypothetical protein
MYTRHAFFVHWSGKQAASGVVVIFIFALAATERRRYIIKCITTCAPLHQLPGCCVSECTRISGRAVISRGIGGAHNDRQQTLLIIFSVNAPSSLSAINWANCADECAHHHAAHRLTSPSSKLNRRWMRGVSETERFVCVALAKSQLCREIFTFAWLVILWTTVCVLVVSWMTLLCNDRRRMSNFCLGILRVLLNRLRI